MSTVMEPESAADEFKAPVVAVGDTVLWYPEAKTSSDPLPAIVVRLIRNTRYIEVWLPDQHKRKRRVRHITDPEAKRQSSVTRTDGGWDYTDLTKAIIRLLGNKAPRRKPDAPHPGNLSPLIPPMEPVAAAPTTDPTKF